MGEPWVVTCGLLLAGSVMLRLVSIRTYDDDDLTPEEVAYLAAGRGRVRLLARARRRLGLPAAPGGVRAALVERGLAIPTRQVVFALALIALAAGLALLTAADVGAAATLPAVSVCAASLLVLAGPRRPIVARWAVRNARARFEQRLRRAPAAASTELVLLMVAFEGRLALDAIIARSALARARVAPNRSVPTHATPARPAPTYSAATRSVPAHATPARATLAPRSPTLSTPTLSTPTPALSASAPGSPAHPVAPLAFVPCTAPVVPQLEWHALVPRAAAPRTAAPRTAAPRDAVPAAAATAGRRITFLGVGRVPSVALRHQSLPAPRAADDASPTMVAADSTPSR